MEANICRGRFADNSEYDWLMMMSLDGTAVSFYRVTLYTIQGKTQCQSVTFG